MYQLDENELNSIRRELITDVKAMLGESITRHELIETAKSRIAIIDNLLSVWYNTYDQVRFVVPNYKSQEFIQYDKPQFIQVLDDTSRLFVVAGNITQFSGKIDPQNIVGEVMSYEIANDDELYFDVKLYDSELAKEFRKLTRARPELALCVRANRQANGMAEIQEINSAYAFNSHTPVDVAV